MKKFIIFLIFTLLISQAFSESAFDKAEEQLNEWRNTPTGKEIEKESKDIIDTLGEVGQQHKPKVEEKKEVHAVKNYFRYEEINKSGYIITGGVHYVVSGTIFPENGDEYFCPLSISYKKNGDEYFCPLAIAYKKNGIEYYDDKKNIKSFIVYKHNFTWYAGILALNLSENNQPHMYLLQMKSKNDAIYVMHEMYATSRYLELNFSDFGFNSTEQYKTSATYTDNDNVDWDSKDSFEITLPEELVETYGYSYCNAKVEVTKYNKINGKKISPSEYYRSHPLKLCNCLNCTIGGLVPYGLERFGTHYGAAYNDKVDTYVDIGFVNPTTDIFNLYIIPNSN